MWLPVKKLILALLMPFMAFFSFSPKEATLPEDLKIAESVETGEVDKIDEKIDLPLTAQALKNCLNQAGKSGDCLDKLLREFLKIHTSIEALAEIQELGEKDTSLRLSCHPIVHAIGRETFSQKKTVHDSFSACDQTCHSGCYHGAMERFLRGDLASEDEAAHLSEEEIKIKAEGACDPSQPLRFRFQCLHGLGHALMFFLDYNLLSSLQSCDVQSDGWSRSSCYGGVFMENVFSATPEKRDLSSADYHYPCSKLDPKYKSDCYMMQTTRMSEMGLNLDRLFEECKKADMYRQICMQSIGRDLSNDARINDPRLTSAKCEKVFLEDRQACTRGVVLALEDNTWDGKYSFPFCASFQAEPDQRYCFQIATAYLKNTFEKSAADVIKECQKYSPENKICLES